MDDAIIGECLQCDQFVYQDDEYEDLGDGYFIHSGCLVGEIDEPSGGPR